MLLQGNVMACGSGSCGRPEDRDAGVPLIDDQALGQALIRCALWPDGEVRSRASAAAVDAGTARAATEASLGGIAQRASFCLPGDYDRPGC
jgi:hypothetical protein